MGMGLAKVYSQNGILAGMLIGWHSSRYCGTHPEASYVVVQLELSISDGELNVIVHPRWRTNRNCPAQMDSKP